MSAGAFIRSEVAAGRVIASTKAWLEDIVKLLDEMEKKMDWDIEKLHKLIQREMFSTVMLSKILLHYASEDRTEFARLMSIVSAEELLRVYDVLSLFPTTNVGWQALPAECDLLLNSELSREEIADIEGRQTQKDRDSVEFLRQAIRPSAINTS